MDTSATRAGEIDHLLEVPFLRQLSVELTTSCNLGCVYCHFAPTTRRGKEAPANVVARVREFCKTFGIDHITLSGDAEITLYPGWIEFARDLLDHGVRLRTISNFSKGLFSEDEVETFSRFTEVVISLDSSDAELMKRVRYRADLRTIVTNLQRVRAAAVLNGRPMPRLVCNITAYDRNITHIDRTVAFALACGFTVVQVNPFVELEEVPGGVNDLRDNPNAWPVRKLNGLSPEDALRALEALTRAVELCRRYSIPASIPNSLRLQLSEALDRGACAAGVWRPIEDTPAETRTKDCVFPWEYMHVFWNGDVPPCCIVKDHAIGNALDEGGLASVFNGPAMRQYRRSLLTGDLMPVCAQCTYATDTNVHHLRQRVEHIVYPPGSEIPLSPREPS